MDVKKNDLPKSVERGVNFVMTQEELLSLLSVAIRSKLQTHQLRLDSIQITGGAEGPGVEISGVEVIPLAWGKADAKSGTAQAPSTGQREMEEAA